MRRLAAAMLTVLAACAAALARGRQGADPATGPWEAAWIWRPSQAPLQVELSGMRWAPPSGDGNVTLQFRREFVLEEVPERAIARVTADSRYRLFVNGTFVARGPAPCDPLRQSFDQVDVKPYLTAGRNVVAAEVHFYGEPMGLWRRAAGDWWAGSAAGRADRAALGAGGFLCEVTDGVKVFVATGTDWKYREAIEWRRPTPKINPALGFVEVYDARRAPEGWTRVGFDDASWSASCALESHGRTRPPIEPYPALEARDVPLLEETPVEPVLILTAGYVEERFDEDPAAAMRSERFVGDPFPFEAVLGAPIRLEPSAGTAASVVFDFGEEVVGHTVLEIADATEGATLDVAWGERTWADLAAFGRRDPAMALPIPGDGRGVGFDPIRGSTVLRYVARAGKQTFTARERAGFRYLQVTARGMPVTLTSVKALRVRYGVPMAGEFECNDPLLNEIWEAGKRTLACCLLDAFVDGPGREQRQYLGDARVQARVARAVLGDERLARRALRAFFLAPRADGMLPIVAPGDAERLGTVIPDYALHGILMLDEYVEATGDDALVLELWPSVQRVLAWFRARERKDGLLDGVPGWVFLDWAEVGRGQPNAILNALYLEAQRAVRRLRSRAGALAAERLPDPSRLAAALAAFRDPQRMLFSDCFDIDGGPCARASVHANAALALAGVLDAAEANAFVRYFRQGSSRIVSARSPLLPPVAIDDSSQIAGASPFFQSFVHLALARFGEHALVLDDIRAHWGPMVAGGGRNVWEGWERTLDSSDCHAWSASPTAFLTEEILGVRCRATRERGLGVAVEVSIRPHAANLTWARGVVPTAAGKVRVEWEAKGGRVARVRGEIPEGAAARIAAEGYIQDVGEGPFDLTIP